jgi:hypothetical protein
MSRKSIDDEVDVVVVATSAAYIMAGTTKGQIQHGSS